MQRRDLLAIAGVASWEIAERGGHFPFLEDADRFVDAIRRFAALV